MTLSTYTQVQAERRAFALRLSNLLADKANIIYFDETTFQHHMRQSAVWSYSHLPITLPLYAQRCKSVTVFGAIGHCLREPLVYEFAESTN